MRHKRSRDPAPLRPLLSDQCFAKGLSDGISRLQTTLVEALNQEIRKVAICARSKRWFVCNLLLLSP